MPEDTKDDKKKYPEVWRMFDGVGTYLGYISENPESSPAPDKLIDVAAAFVPANNIPRNLQNITADDFINATVNRYL